MTPWTFSATSADSPYLRFGPGTEPVAWVALLLSVAACVAAMSPWTARALSSLQPRYLVGTLAASAALLSLGYLGYYLRGGPRIIDATAYLLEARSIARGAFTFPTVDPEASFAGRFLLSPPNSSELGVIFPPGYPAALAPFAAVGAPLLLGPCVAALLVATTYWLARELGARPTLACLAAALSALSATLRYHTADTMSHGWSALLVSVSIAAAARPSPTRLALSAASTGWLIATRPVTGIVTLIFTAWLARAAGRRALVALLALLPGVLLLLFHQRALTGSFFLSPQMEYYRVADGPPGCFRYGFGQGVGCLFEHGDFVRARLADGFGPLQGLATTFRRLCLHTLDVANFAPLFLFVPFGAWIARKNRPARSASALILALPLAYLPFYFEGSYPGGGARFLADALPLEHALVAIGIGATPLARWAAPLALLGFALQTHHQHAALRDREGGRPMFEPGLLRDQGLARGLVLVSTDHGFFLGHQPGRLAAEDGVVVARERGDAVDFWLWDRLGRPPTFRYEYDPGAEGALPRLAAHSFADQAPTRLEAESLWPPREVASGWVHEAHSPEACASGGRGLRFHPAGAPARIRVRLPRALLERELRVGWVGDAGGPVRWGSPRLSGSRVLSWALSAGACRRSARLEPIPSSAGTDVWIEASGGLFDYVEAVSGSNRKGVDN